MSFNWIEVNTVMNLSSPYNQGTHYSLINFQLLKDNLYCIVGWVLSVGVVFLSVSHFLSYVVKWSVSQLISSSVTLSRGLSVDC